MKYRQDQIPHDRPNPDPTYWNVSCTYCGAHLHRTQSTIDTSPNKRFYCNADCRETWKREHRDVSSAVQKRLNKTTGASGPMLRVGGVVYA